jgi:hypothetical protein
MYARKIHAGQLAFNLLEIPMENQLPEPMKPLKISAQMRAVLLIFSADPALLDQVMPHIDLANESIYWEQIFQTPLSSGHRSAANWAYSVWRDELRPKADYFDGALMMSSSLKAAVIKALGLRWGLSA